ncbi:MAG TPA: hypothetical protein VII06_33615 [Chloroflexota bacterium]
MYDLPSYVWALVLAGAIGLPAATSVLLYRGARAAGVGRCAAAGAAGVSAGLLGGWLVITGALARARVYDGPQGGLWFGVAFAGFLGALLLATRIPLVSRVLAEPGTAARLVLPHTVRVVGVVFLLLMVQGVLPAAFALPAGLGDVAIGVAAPFVARRLARAPLHAGAVASAVRFNLLGLLDLAVAVILGVLLGLPGLFALTPSTEPLRLLPLALIPTAAVPLAIALHVVSLLRLHAAVDRIGTSHVPTPGSLGSPQAAES